MRSDLTRIATGRDASLFAPDVEARHREITETYRRRRILVIGGAGSIGSATLRLLLAYRPAAVHVVDQDENGLAELVRDLRSADLVGDTELRLMPLDYGAPVTRQFLRRCGPYDVVLHFAAMKHVRSEKDPASILHMIDTNVLKQHRLMAWLADDGSPLRYFAVSTDKAANPVNFMGASKRLMELCLFTESVCPLRQSTRTSARFANVAFSAGSLLESFEKRLEQRQPVAVPRDTRRYFVSLKESGQICLLASAAFESAAVAIPRLRAESDMRELRPIAEAFLHAAGLRPVEYDDEGSARVAVERDAAMGRWPLLVTPRDTSGEKGYEEFVGATETTLEVGLQGLLAVPQPGCDAVALDAVLAELRARVEREDASPATPEIGAVLSRVVEGFRHVASARGLDDRM